MCFRLIQAVNMAIVLQLHAPPAHVEAPLVFQGLEGLAVQVPSAAPNMAETKQKLVDDARPRHASLPGALWPVRRLADWLACAGMSSPPARDPHPLQLCSAAALTWDEGQLPGQLGPPSWADPEPAPPGTRQSVAVVKAEG